MNKSIKTFLAVLFIALTTVSCSEDEVVAFFPGDELGELRMNFKYNGTLYNITDPTTYNAANKTIDGKQCTIISHVDDLKILHVNKRVVEDIIQKLNCDFRKETQLTTHRGKFLDYLGMTID